VFLMPLFHPAAALRTPALVDILRQDFAKLPDLLEAPPLEAEAGPDVVAELSPAAATVAAAARANQLDLFAA
jgi:DNA polymerase